MGTELEECLRPDLPVLHLYSSSRSDSIFLLTFVTLSDFISHLEVSHREVELSLYITFMWHTPPLFQMHSLLLWCVVDCWVPPGPLRAWLPASPGVEPTTALLIGSTFTSRAAALTCWPHLLMGPGLCTSARSVMDDGSAVRYHLPPHLWLQVSCSSYIGQLKCVCLLQALRMMLGLDLLSVHHRNLTLNRVPVPNREPLFQNGKPFSTDSVTKWCSKITMSA